MIKLSIFIPIRNEKQYIKECLNSLLEDPSHDFEIVLSDNHSDDGTWELINSFNDKRLNIFRPNKKLPPQKHYCFALSKCVGEFVFNIGGDDFFEKDVLNKIIPRLRKNNIYIARFRTFDDKSGKTLSIPNDSVFLNKFLLNNKSFVSNYLKQINHDEIMYSFIPKILIMKSSFYIGNCNEYMLPWVAIYVFSIINNSDVNINYIDEVVYSKRYNKLYNHLNYARDYQKGIINNLFTIRSLGSLYNCFVFLILTLDYKNFIRLCFYNRSIERDKNQKGGFIGMGKNGYRRWYFGPIMMVVISPILDVLKTIKHGSFLFSK